MKEQSKQELKQIILQSLSQYFQKSGINEILLKLYQGQNYSIQTKPAPNKIQNIIQSNTQKMSRVQELKRKHGNERLSFDDDETNIPILETQSNKITPNLRAKLNQNLDPIQNGGQSILDNIDELPLFLKKGLNKAKKFQRNA